MNRKSWIAVLIIAVSAGGLTLAAVRPHRHVAAAPTPTPLEQGNYVAGPGRVEPISEDIQVGSELSGKLRDVLVEEGDQVRPGQIVAVLENSDLKAQILTAAAQIRQNEAELRKTINGARSEQRREALSSVDENAAVLENARVELLRHNELFNAGIISREQKDEYDREFQVARARWDEARQHHALIDDKPREEDIAAAQAALELAKAQLADARARCEKTLIRSPIQGVILRKHHRAGESVSNSSTVPDPIVTIGDDSILRVRVDVDETDVAKVKVGQQAFVTADAYGSKKFAGHVVRVGNELGPKNVHTDEPTEKVDTKILETLVQLDPGTKLPVGLRVDGYIKTDSGAASNPR